MRRAASVFLLATLSCLLLQGTATAGGWWAYIGLDGEYLGVGESLKHHVSEAFFGTVEEGKRAHHTPYYAYLFRDFDRKALDREMRRAEPGNWWRTPGETTLAGTVDLINWDHRTLSEGTLHLTVPHVPTGSYYLMLCDAGCRNPLGDIIPARVHIVADAATAQVIRKLKRTTIRLQEALRQGDQTAQQELHRLELQIHELRVSAAQSEQAVARLNGQVAVLRRDRPSTPWIAFAGWFLAGTVLSALVLLLFRGRKPAPPSEPRIQVELPNDARELTEAP